MADLSLTVTGDAQLAQLAAHVLEVGTVELKLELMKALEEGSAFVARAVEASAETLPREGGLAAHVAADRVETRPILAERSFGVSVAVSDPSYDVKSINRGRLRHPVFGNRQVWVLQDIRPGWFDNPVRTSIPVYKARVQAAARRIARKIEGSHL